VTGRSSTSVLMVATGILTASTLAFVNLIDMPLQPALMVFGAILFVATGIALVTRWSTKVHREDVQRGNARAILLTGGFRAVAARLKLEGPSVKDPALRGTYRNRRINVLVGSSRSSDDSIDGDSFEIVVRAHRGSRWRRRFRLDWGKPPAELSLPALLALERLKQRKKLGRQIDSIRVGAEELSCVTRDEITGAVSLNEALTDTALPQPTELEAILDDLVTLADGLPVLDAPHEG
jgi:hypothetical protein